MDVLKFLTPENDDFQVRFISSDFQWSIIQLQSLGSDVSSFEVMSPSPAKQSNIGLVDISTP